MTNPVIIGDATLYLGDSEALLPNFEQLEPRPFDVVSDPQYLFAASGGGKFRKARKCLDQIQAAGLDKGFDKTLITAARFGHVALFCHNDQLYELLPYLKAEYGRYVVCDWIKTNPMPVANKHLVPDIEFWVHAWRDGHAPIGELVGKRRHWVGPNGKQDVYDHPTVKPIDLMRKIVRTVPGRAILDPFMGTGTTLAAALIEGRRAVGIEKNPVFFAMAVDRIKRIYAQGLFRKGTVA